jgi:hypothetical protein
MRMQDAIDAYKSAITEEYGYITVGYHTFTAGQVFENCLDRKEFNRLVLSYVVNNRKKD